MPHHIRLAGPWDRNDGCKDPEEWQRSQLPAEIGLSSQIRRRFHRPSGLNDQSQVSIVIQATEAVQVELNGRPLLATTDGKEQVFSASEALVAFNCLILKSATAAEVVQVQIRIEEAADL